MNVYDIMKTCILIAGGCCQVTTMFKSLVIALAASVVAASKGKYECSDVVSGSLQTVNYNSTQAPMIVGVNATKSGEYLTSFLVTKPLEVVFEQCMRSTGQEGVSTVYYRLVAQKNRDLCVTHTPDKRDIDRLLRLEKCEGSTKKGRQTQEFDVIYGKRMKGENATVVAHERNGTDVRTFPFSMLYETNVTRDGKEVTLDVNGLGSTRTGTELLQIGNPKEEK